MKENLFIKQLDRRILKKMSDLRHQSIEELQKRKISTEKYIQRLQMNLNAEQQRLVWIDKYLSARTLGILEKGKSIL